jgi:hypothetical protein
MPYSTFQATGRFLLTEKHYLTLVERPPLWVPGTPEPSSQLTLLVYERLPSDPSGKSVNFTIKDSQFILAGIPGSVFSVENTGFLPLMSDASLLFKGPQNFTGFLLTSNQFNKILHFNITGNISVWYNATGTISSQEFGLIAFNSFQAVEATIRSHPTTPFFWLIIMGITGLIILGIVIIFIGTLVVSCIKKASSKSGNETLLASKA